MPRLASVGVCLLDLCLSFRNLFFPRNVLARRLPSLDSVQADRVVPVPALGPALGPVFASASATIPLALAEDRARRYEERAARQEVREIRAWETREREDRRARFLLGLALLGAICQVVGAIFAYNWIDRHVKA